MATTYIRFEAEAERERVLKKLFVLQENDEAADIFMEKIKVGYERGGMTVVLEHSKNPITPYQELVNRLADVGLTGVRFQRTYKGEKAAWLILRTKTTEHKEKLDAGLEDMGFVVI